MALTGFTLLDIAAFQWNSIAGFAVAGICVLILEALGGD